MVLSNTATPKPKAHFLFIDGLRGLAALWVILYHADPDGRISNLTSALPQWIVDEAFRWGSRGVAIFFVLSGFVMAFKEFCCQTVYQAQSTLLCINVCCSGLCFHCITSQRWGF